MIAKKNDLQNDMLKEVNSEGIYESAKTLTFIAPAKTERIPQEEYDQLVEPYREAMTRLEVRMNGLNEDYRKNIEIIQSTIYRPVSKAEKALKKNLPAKIFQSPPTRQKII